MVNLSEREEIIDLINQGVKLDLLSFELEIPMEEIQTYEKQLAFRKSIKQQLDSGEIQNAATQLETFIAEEGDYALVEKYILAKLNTDYFKTGENTILSQIENERREQEIAKDFQEILHDLKIQIPRRKKNSNKKREIQKENPPVSNEDEIWKDESEVEFEEDTPEPTIDYDAIIADYKEKIAAFPQKSLNYRNLLAYTYFKAGKVDEARDELLDLVDQTGSYVSYKQLVFLESQEENYDDAKMWAYDCLEKFPNSIDIREQLIGIAKKEGNRQEVIKRLKEIIELEPNQNKYQKRLETMIKEK